MVVLEELCHLGKGGPIVRVLEQTPGYDVLQWCRHFRRDAGPFVQLNEPFVDFAVPVGRGGGQRQEFSSESAGWFMGIQELAEIHRPKITPNLTLSRHSQINRGVNAKTKKNKVEWDRNGRQRRRKKKTTPAKN